MQFSVQVHDQQGLTVVGLAGELDIQPAADLRMLFDTLVEDRQVNVLVDLHLLTFCDSVGLSALIHGFHACSSAGGSFRLTGDTGLVSRLLQVTGVGGILLDQPETGTATRSGGRADVDGSGRRARGSWHWDSGGSGVGRSSDGGRDEGRGGAPMP
jgi:anti-sigma B factor antagonist